MKYLTTEQVMRMHEEIAAVSGGSPEIRDAGLLESALQTPFQTYSGQALYPTMLEKAARLGYGLIRNHPFVDGNKRIGCHVMLVFLALNHIPVNYTDEELIRLILGVAAGELDDTALLHWLQQHTA